MTREEEFYKNLEPFLKCRDYLVSDQTFELKINQFYQMLVTYPKPSDLDKFYENKSYISHTDSKKSLFDKVYQLVRNYTLNKKVRLLNSFKLEEKKVLDIGAGTGDFLLTCKKKGWDVFGIEPNDNARKIAKSKNINLKKTLLEYQSQKFDIVTLWHVLEHVPDLFEYTKQLKQLLKPNGTLIIAVPNYRSFDAKFYKSFWAAYDVPRHLWHFSQNSIQKLFGQVDMKIAKTIPMKFDSYYVSLLSEKHKTGKMNIFKSFWIGWLSNRKASKTKEYSSLTYVLQNS